LHYDKKIILLNCIKISSQFKSNSCILKNFACLFRFVKIFGEDISGRLLELEKELSAANKELADTNSELAAFGKLLDEMLACCNHQLATILGNAGISRLKIGFNLKLIHKINHLFQNNRPA
jgi:hypothetical protein